MKTNLITLSRVLFTLIAIAFFPFISKAQLNVTTANKVGIGTAAPGNKLHIYNSISDANWLGRFQNGTSNVYLSHGTGYGIHINTGNTSSSQYALEVFNGTSNIAMFRNDGKVGIGTSSPAVKFVVSNGGAAGFEFITTGNIGGGTGGYIQQYNRAASAYTELGYNALSHKFFTSGGELMRITSSGLWIGTTSSTYTFDVNGTAHCSASAWSSDQLFKTNIDSVRDALTIIDQLKPKSYYFDTLNNNGLKFPSEKQYGFIAQDLEQILPELVTTTTKNADYDSLGNVVHPAVTYKAVYYLELISILTKGIQEQQQKIDNLSTGLLAERAKTNEQDSIITSLQNQMNQLLTNVTNCCLVNGGRSMQSPETIAQTTNQTEVKLTDAQSIVLEQNVPNPFAEQTSISYYLPDNTKKAQMLFYNAQGRLIQSTDLIQKGKGVVNVFASDLSNGIYTYTLVVDGKIIETKKMVKQ